MEGQRENQLTNHDKTAEEENVEVVDWMTWLRVPDHQVIVSPAQPGPAFLVTNQ